MFRIRQDSTTMDDGTDGYIRPNATFVEQFAIGFCYCCSSAIFLFLQFSILAIFFTYKDYYKNMCYRIMIVISIVDSVQLFVHFYGGLIAIFNSSFNYWLEKILGGLLNSFCIALFPLCLVLAVERLLVYLPRIFSDKTEVRLVALMIGLCFVWALPFFIAYMTPYTGIVFRTYAWDYDDSPQANWTFVQNIDESSSMPILAVTFIIYLLILGILIYKRRFNHPENSSEVLIAPHEKRLLFQSLIQFWLELSLNTLWLFQAFSLLPDFPLSEAAINFYWIFFNGIKPILYLIFNIPIRERTFRLWRCQGKERLQISSDPIADIVLQQQPQRTSIPSAKVSPLPQHPPLSRPVSVGNFGRRFRMEKEIRFSNGQIQMIAPSTGDGIGGDERAKGNQRASLPHFSFTNDSTK